jgi:hypothetical protein
MVQEIDLCGSRLSPNAVFEHPSITAYVHLLMCREPQLKTRRIAQLLVSLSSGEEAVPAQRSPIEIMMELVKKYSSFAYTPKTHAVSGTSGIVNGSVARVVSPCSYKGSTSDIV